MARLTGNLSRHCLGSDIVIHLADLTEPQASKQRNDTSGKAVDTGSE